MKLQHILAAATAILAIGVAGPRAEAQDMEATIKVQNNTPDTIDCKIFWGNNQIPFEGIAAASASDEKTIPVSGGDRNLVCRKKGAAPTKANVSPLLKFKSDVAGKYTATCGQNPDGTGFACSVAKP
jgi:hypothetical protein